MEDQDMKRLLLPLMLLMFAFSARASYHPNPSELVIRLYDNAVFNISVGNQEYSSFSTQYTIPGLRPGRHFIRITRYQQVFAGRSVRYINPQLAFEGYINIPAGRMVYSYIDHRNRYRVEETLALRHHPAPRPAPAARPHPAGRPIPMHNYYTPAMSPAAFANLKATLANTPFDSSRLKVAEHAIAHNHVSSQQVLELMHMFTFESNRLSLAQFAYPYTVDKNNFFIVHNAFSFSSSTQKLNTFIAQNY